VLGVIALIAPPAIFAIVRRARPSQTVDQRKSGKPQRALGATN
jgi:hypothetical protein